jgi:hypothetical protein
MSINTEFVWQSICRNSRAILNVSHCAICMVHIATLTWLCFY